MTSQKVNSDREDQSKDQLDYILNQDLKDYIASVEPSLKFKKTKEGWACPCPIHNGENNKFHIDTNKNVWRCQSGCGGDGGSIITFVMRFLKVNKGEAIRILKSHYGLSDDYSKEYLRSRPKANKKEAPKLPPYVAFTTDKMGISAGVPFIATKKEIDYNSTENSFKAGYFKGIYGRYVIAKTTHFYPLNNGKLREKYRWELYADSSLTDRKEGIFFMNYGNGQWDVKINPNISLGKPRKYEERWGGTKDTEEIYTLPYNYSQVKLLLENSPNSLIVGVEGEPDVNFLRDLGIASINSRNLSKSEKLQLLKDLGAGGLIVISDNDPAGVKYAEGVVSEARLISLPCLHIPISTIWKEAPEKSDIRDYGKTLNDEQLKALPDVLAGLIKQEVARYNESLPEKNSLPEKTKEVTKAPDTDNETRKLAEKHFSLKTRHYNPIADYLSFELLEKEGIIADIERFYAINGYYPNLFLKAGLGANKTGVMIDLLLYFHNKGLGCRIFTPTNLLGNNTQERINREIERINNQSETEKITGKCYHPSLEKSEEYDFLKDESSIAIMCPHSLHKIILENLPKQLCIWEEALSTFQFLRDKKFFGSQKRDVEEYCMRLRQALKVSAMNITIDGNLNNDIIAFVETVTERESFIVELKQPKKKNHKMTLSFERGKGRKRHQNYGHAKAIRLFHGVLNQGKKAFFTSDGKELLREVETDLLNKNIFKQTAKGDPYNYLIIESESDNQTSSAFMSNPIEYLKNHPEIVAVLYSPSMNSGVDISGVTELGFTAQYGVFIGVVSIERIDQQIFRIRDEDIDRFISCVAIRPQYLLTENTKGYYERRGEQISELRKAGLISEDEAIECRTKLETDPMLKFEMSSYSFEEKTSKNFGESLKIFWELKGFSISSGEIVPEERVEMDKTINDMIEIQEANDSAKTKELEEKINHQADRIISGDPDDEVVSKYEKILSPSCLRELVDIASSASTDNTESSQNEDDETRSVLGDETMIHTLLKFQSPIISSCMNFYFLQSGVRPTAKLEKKRFLIQESIRLHDTVYLGEDNDQTLPTLRKLTKLGIYQWVTENRENSVTCLTMTPIVEKFKQLHKNNSDVQKMKPHTVMSHLLKKIGLMLAKEKTTYKGNVYQIKPLYGLSWQFFDVLINKGIHHLYTDQELSILSLNNEIQLETNQWDKVEIIKPVSSRPIVETVQQPETPVKPDFNPIFEENKDVKIDSLKTQELKEWIKRLKVVKVVNAVNDQFDGLIYFKIEKHLDRAVINKLLESYGLGCLDESGYYHDIKRPDKPKTSLNLMIAHHPNREELGENWSNKLQDWIEGYAYRNGLIPSDMMSGVKNPLEVPIIRFQGGDPCFIFSSIAVISNSINLTYSDMFSHTEQCLNRILGSQNNAK